MNTELAREQMLGQQVRAWDVLDSRVLDVMASVPREAFVPEAYRDLAFADTAIPLAHGQEMMAPKVEGRLLQALQLQPHHEVLEVGTGSGFLTACLARLSGEVFSIDIHDDFILEAGRRLETHGVHNVRLEARDVFAGPAPGPFDAIAITGSLPILDPRFIQWLKPGGRLFVVTGTGPAMEAQAISQEAAGEWLRESLFETVLPPLENAPRPSAFRF